jgi:transposase
MRHTTATHRREKNGETDGSTTSKCYWAGATQQAVANHFGVTRHTISNLWSRHNATSNVRDRTRSGRPRVTFAVQDRYIRLRHSHDRTLKLLQAQQRQPFLVYGKYRIRLYGSDCTKPATGGGTCCPKTSHTLRSNPTPPSGTFAMVQATKKVDKTSVARNPFLG